MLFRTSNQLSNIGEIETHAIPTRHACQNTLVRPKMNLCIGQRNIKYYGVKIWHDLDPALKPMPSLDSFKDAIKKL